jgi:hypothetical protein
MIITVDDAQNDALGFVVSDDGNSGIKGKKNHRNHASDTSLASRFARGDITRSVMTTVNEFIYMA